MRLLFTLNVQRCIGYGHSARFYPCNLPCNPCMSPPYRTPSPLSFATRERLTRHPSARNEEYTSAPRGTPSLLLRARETIQVHMERCIWIAGWLVGRRASARSVVRSIEVLAGYFVISLSLSSLARPDDLCLTEASTCDSFAHPIFVFVPASFETRYSSGGAK